MKYLALLLLVFLTSFGAKAACDTPAVKITGVTPHQVIVYWDTVAGASAYQYVISTSIPPGPIGTTVSSNTIMVSGLIPGKNYIICVRTICHNDTSAWKCVPVSTPPLPPNCNRPGKLYFRDVTGQNTVLSWDTVTAAIGYEFVVSEYPVILQNSIPSFTTLSFVPLAGLKPGTLYEACVRTICRDDTSGWICDTISTKPTGIKPVGGMARLIKAYPNPVLQSLTIELQSSKEAHILITDVLGKVVFQSSVSSVAQIIDVKSWTSGVYFIKYIDGEYSGTIKILKE